MRVIKAKPVGCATNQGYDPWLALCVARIKRARLDNDLEFFRSVMYEWMFRYCELSVPGFFPVDVDLILPDGVEIGDWRLETRDWRLTLVR